MALKFNLVCQFNFVDLEGKLHEGGKPLLTVTTSGNAIHDQTHSIAASSRQKLWDTADATTAADFEVLFFMCDQAGELMFTNNSNGTLWIHNTIVDFPFILGTDASNYGATVGTFGGTADDIEEIHFENGSSTTACNARLVMVT